MTEPKQIPSSLFALDPAAYGPDYQSHLLEQYKLFVESSQKVSDWRNATNNYFITVNAALAALYGLLPSESVLPFWRYAIPLVGVVVCAAWSILITSYRNLNTAKFAIIHELESRLPVPLFHHEWELLKKGRGRFYRPVSHVERWIPVAVALVHVALAAAVFFTPAPRDGGPPQPHSVSARPSLTPADSLRPSR